MTSTMKTVEISKIREVSNIRQSLGDVRALASSIEAVGLLNPLTVISEPEGHYRLIAGHRRLEALRQLGSSEVPVYVVEFVSQDQESVIATQLVENLQREDLDPLEEAEALADLVEILGTQKAAASAIGRSAAHLSKRLKIRQLPDEAKSALRSGDLNLEDAFEITKLDEPAAAKVAKSFGDSQEKGSRDLSEELIRHERDEESRKAARAVAGQDHRQGWTVVATPDLDESWQSLEGWQGLAVDQDLHEAEPCHRLVVGYQSRWATEIREEYFCAEPERHGPEGDSDNKVIDQAAAHAEEEEKRRQERAERQEKLDAKREQLGRQALEIAAGLNRNDAVKVLSRFILDIAALQPETYLEAFGVKLPEEPESQPWEDPESWNAYEAELAEAMNAAPDSKLYRAAALYVLTETTHHPTLWQREKPEHNPIASILGIEIDREEI